MNEYKNAHTFHPADPFHSPVHQLPIFTSTYFLLLPFMEVLFTVLIIIVPLLLLIALLFVFYFLVIRRCCKNKDKKKNAAAKKREKARNKKMFSDVEQNPEDPYFSYAQFKQIAPIKIQKELKLPAPEECEPDGKVKLRTGQVLRFQAQQCEAYQVGSNYEIVVDQEGKPVEDSARTITDYTLSEETGDYETEVDYSEEQQSNEFHSHTQPDEGVVSLQEGLDFTQQLVQEQPDDSQQAPVDPAAMTVMKVTESLNSGGYGTTAAEPTAAQGTASESPYPV